MGAIFPFKHITILVANSKRIEYIILKTIFISFFVKNRFATELNHRNMYCSIFLKRKHNNIKTYYIKF